MSDCISIYKYLKIKRTEKRNLKDVLIKEIIYLWNNYLDVTYLKKSKISDAANILV